VTETLHYRAAGGVVASADGRVLVLYRPSRNEVRLPKGHVEEDEDARQAALRETAEESGYHALAITADLGEQVVSFTYKERFIVRRERYFLMTLIGNGDFQAAEDQFQPEWLTWSQALEALTFSAEREWLRRAQAALSADS
jgi:8-oxo-dGTP diphosphatase